MSQKITGKNLHYDDSLPPFLRRLKGQHAADAESPDPILASRRRAAKKRSASEEAEDAPLIVDDDGNVVSGMQVGADGTVTGETEDKKAEDGGGKEGTKDEPAEQEKVAAIGGSKKRKVGKVIGADAEDEDQDEAGATTKERKDSEKDRSGAATEKKATEKKADSGKSKELGKAKKKSKKIKLSFGDDDGD